MSEIGNYFMLVTVDGDGVLSRTFRDVSTAALNGFLAVLKIYNADVPYFFFVTSVDVENLTVTFGEISFVADDIDGYPAISE